MPSGITWLNTGNITKLLTAEKLINEKRGIPKRPFDGVRAWKAVFSYCCPKGKPASRSIAAPIKPRGFCLVAGAGVPMGF